MSTVCRRLEISIRANRQRMLGAVQWVCVLCALALTGAAQGQTPDITASAANQGSALIQWSFSLVGGGTVSWIQIQHCNVSVAACTDPSASPTIFQGSVTLTNCDTISQCPNYVIDTQLTASTTYVEKVTMYPSASNTTGQITSVLSLPYTTTAFPVPSITSFQATSGSSGLLTTNESDQYYAGVSVYGCPGSGCTNFIHLGDSGCVDCNTGGGIAPSTVVTPLYGLTASTTYTVYVTAFDLVNTSPASPTFTFETPPPDTTPPTAPTNLTASVVSPTQVSFSWGSSTDDLYLAAYEVQGCAGAGCTNFSNDCGSSVINSELPLSCTATGLTPSTTYRFRVVALDGSQNQSAPSNVVTVTTLPGVPTTLTATNTTSGQVTLTWTPAGNAAGLAGYLVEQCQGTGCTFSQVAQVTSPSAQITGLTPRSTYQFRVRSVDPSGDDSGYSNVVTVTTLPLGAPSAFTAAGLSDSQITLTWTASSDPSVSAYLIERCTVGSCTSFAQVGSTPGSPYMDGGLLPLTTYQYRILAQDAAGDLSDPVTASASTLTLAPPTNLSGTAVSTSQITLSWFASPSAGITRYLLERCAGAGCTSFSQFAAVSGAGYSDTGLATNTTYVYRVRGTDPAGALSDYAPAVTVKTLALDPPTGLTPTAISSAQINLSWSASDSPGVTGYIVQRCNGVGCNGFAQISNVTSLSFADASLSASTTYTYRVLATDSGGDLSAPSNVASSQSQSGSGGGTGPGGPGGGTGSNPATYIYDPNGHLQKVITSSGTVTYTYDAAGHLVSIQSGP